MIKISVAFAVFCMAMPWTAMGGEIGLRDTREDRPRDDATHDLRSAGPPVETISLPEAREIAKEAYIFFQPVIDQYHLKVEYSKLGLPPNWLHMYTLLPDPDTDQLTTPYKFPHQFYGIALLDLRKEPIIVYSPAVDRMSSIMLTDHFEHNFAYFGSRTTGNGEGNYMIAGPNWSGDIPSNVNGLATAESNFVTLNIRVPVNPESPQDREKAEELLSSFSLTPLSVFSGEHPTPPLPYPDFEYDANQQERAGFFSYVNNFTAFAEIYPDEQDLYNRFAHIGVIPGMQFPPVNMSSTMIEAIEQGIWEGSNAINSEMARPKGVNHEGWHYEVDPPMNGDREDMDQRYLARAASARSTFEWGNSVQEAIYMQTFTNYKGRPLDGRKKYTLHWTAEQIPKTHPMGFWTITLYDVNGHYTKNAINRYAIGTQSDLQYGTDGSLTIYIQRRSPGKEKRSNWLPCPCGRFQLFLRIYWPADEMITGDYATHVPPGARIA